MQADILIRNARLGPGKGEGNSVCIAIGGGRILALGGDIVAEGARVIDAGGAVLLPGFVESHVHVFTGGATLAQLRRS